METPTYFGLLQLARSLGYKILEIPLDPDLGLTPERFQQAVQKSSGRMKALSLAEIAGNAEENIFEEEFLFK